MRTRLLARLESSLTGGTAWTRMEDTACRVLLSVDDLRLCSIKGGGVFLLKHSGIWDRHA
ncbi:hypothetical protein JY651_43525 [Pyxidicoccus parkwayensis]|uniref:Uncharacterized protein n=1 Tax=Pyxidicoccus parkwayensis TaxID=2813578 RepID=A0ABX7NST0_9BACT|nr:hypothetical protein [Pyxidicoccus parkwaysis]QSQ21945.1 hypothetical protein JY651_43525 [Pyxidicoccus parkwaysis]